MKCVSYTRATSCLAGEANPQNTISQQNQAIAMFLKERGWTIEKKYSDRQKSNEADSAFQQMRKDGMARQFEMVVVSSAFRCGRGISFAEDLLLKTFLPAGIHFAVAEDGFCSLDHSLEEAKRYLVDKRLKSNVSKMREAERARERQGFLDVHDEKYGYLLNPEFTGFEIDKEAAPVIQEIFQRLADNATMQSVANTLNDRGIESPAQHLARVGKKRFQANGSKWSMGSIQRIVRNTAYIGYWTKMVDGEKRTVSTPAIVDKDLFERAGNNITSRARPVKPYVKSENAFVKHIFDKKSGKALICKRYSEDGDYQMFHRRWFDTTGGISYEAVSSAAISALREESNLAEKVEKLLRTEIAIAEKDRRLRSIADTSKRMFFEMDTIERERLDIYKKFQDGHVEEHEMQKDMAGVERKLKDLDEQFERLMQQREEIEKAFSAKNPWISCYCRIVIPDVLTKRDVRKWINKIVIEDFSDIKVDLVLQEWKRFFPSEWIEGSTYHGEKE